MVLVTGCFNVLHAGHVDLLEFASMYGPVSVGINGDEYIKKKYGDAGVPAKQRARVIGACKYVSEVWVFEEPTPSELIVKLQPKYFIRGPDYLGKELAEQWALNQAQTKLIIYPGDKINSSTKLMNPENCCSFLEYGIEFLK